MDRPQVDLRRFAWLSIAAALLTIGLKTTAYLFTGSVGLLSDALESLVNLAAAIMALAMLTVAARPPDELHEYGHGKAEYFSSGFEGGLILLAAVMIIWTAIPRLLAPQPLEQVGLGLVVSVMASAINYGVARVLLRAGREHRSITLEADAHHLMTDVWTSVGVIAGIALVWLTGWQRLDPIIALLVAANIIWIGVGLLRRSVAGLMDAALPAAEEEAAKQVLRRYQEEGIEFHALRTRQVAAGKILSVHILVPGEWTVERGHQVLERVEAELEKEITGLLVFTHLEPLDDPAALQDAGLDHPLQHVV